MRLSTVVEASMRSLPECPRAVHRSMASSARIRRALASASAVLPSRPSVLRPVSSSYTSSYLFATALSASPASYRDVPLQVRTSSKVVIASPKLSDMVRVEGVWG